MKEIWSNQICRKHCIHPQIWTCVGLLLPPSHISRVWLCATPETAAHQVPRPRDSPGKNTGVGCHFLLQCMKVKSLSRVQLLATPWTVAHQALLSHKKEWNNAICTNIDEPKDYHTKWTKSERESQIPYDITSMWNLKYNHKWIYLQNKNSLTNKKKRLMVGKG